VVVIGNDGTNEKQHSNCAAVEHTFLRPSGYTYRRSRLESFFSFLAAALPGFALALLSFLSFFFSPCVIFSDLTTFFPSCCLTMVACCGGGCCALLRLCVVRVCALRTKTMNGGGRLASSSVVGRGATSNLVETVRITHRPNCFAFFRPRNVRFRPFVMRIWNRP
jgi:hypothetical protein